MKHRNDIPNEQMGTNFPFMWTTVRLPPGSNIPSVHWDRIRGWLRDSEFDGYWYARHSDCERYLEMNFTNPDAAFECKMKFG
ncbi:MAG: hypothetical protein EOP83_23455 [Verrucomicrobiaceae bacterium]|nr:MAG: hypothetical protein EOP83_23455 [Verrucomicrobiaceae bacterium]